jgi:hypothetical protein
MKLFLKEVLHGHLKKKVTKSPECWVFKGLTIDTNHTPLLCHITTALMWPPLQWQNIHKSLPGSGTKPVLTRRVSTEVTFWHSAEYGSDFRCNSGEIPRNSAEFRGISPELRRNHFRSQKIPRNSVSAEFRGHPTHTYTTDVPAQELH